MSNSPLDQTWSSDEIKNLGGNLMWVNSDGTTASAGDLNPEQYAKVEKALIAGNTPRQALASIGITGIA